MNTKRPLSCAYRMPIRKAVWTLLAVMVVTTLSLAQLTYTTSCTGSCQEAEQCTYSNWAYTDSSHVKHSFPGSDTMTVIECKFEHFTDLDTFSTDKEYYLRAVANVGTASPSGILYPQYEVVSIVYSTPGNESSNGFTNTTTDGTTTGIGSNYSAGWTDTFTSGLDGLLGGGTMSWSYGITASDGSTTTWSNTVADASGVANASSPSGPNNVSHNQDLIIVWLNPSIQLATTGSSTSIFGLGTQLQSSGAGEAVDTVEVTAKTMMANSSGVTIVPLAILEPQTYDGQTLPGLAAICANQQYYPNNCSNSPNQQCGCVPSDFTNILAADPLVNYNQSENPLDLDTSGATACTNPASTAKCRYVPIMTTNGGSLQESEPVAGPECSGCDPIINTFTQTDSTQTAETLNESLTQTVSYGWSVTLPGQSGISSTDTFAWTDSESTGSVNGSDHTMTVTLESSTVGCYEEIPIFMDTVYHTFVFYMPSGNNSCP
jgi:hypothetical protein